MEIQAVDFVLAYPQAEIEHDIHMKLFWEITIYYFMTRC